MSLILLEGFDDGLRDTRWIPQSLPAPVAQNNRLGMSQRLGRNIGMTYLIGAADEDDTLTWGEWLYPSVLPAGLWDYTTMHWQFKSDGNTTTHLSVSVALGFFQIRRGGTILANSGYVWSTPGTGKYVEIEVHLHDTNGTVRIWADGVLVIELLNVDTKNGGTKTVFDSFRRFGGTLADDGMIEDIDDIYLINSKGAAPFNSRLGDVVVDTLLPNGNGAHSDFLGSDADKVDNYLLVSENPHDADVTYVESGTDLERDSYGFSDLAYASGSILGVQATTTARNLGAADNCLISTRIAGTDYDGTTQTVPAAYDASIVETWELSPASGLPWTMAELNAAEFGIENTP